MKIALTITFEELSENEKHRWDNQRYAESLTSGRFCAQSFIGSLSSPLDLIHMSLLHMRSVCLSNKNFPTMSAFVLDLILIESKIK